MIIKNPSFIQTLSLKYYIVIPHIFVFYKILDLTHNAAFTLLILRIVVMVLNNILPKDVNNLSKDLSKQFNQNDSPHILPLYINIIAVKILQWGVFVNYNEFFLSTTQKIFGALLLSSLTISTFDSTHQLLHRDNKFHKIVAYLNLIPFLFTVYPFQHVLVHHKAVGTIQDPITAPKNKSVYAYYINVIYQSYKINYDYSKLLFLLCVGLHLGWIIFLYQYFGRQVMLFGIFYAILAIFLVQTIEYIQHYGLVIRKSKDQKISMNSAWNSYFPYINYVIHSFQRHSDHHVNAYKIYNTMDLTTQMPKLDIDFVLASGYALTPKAWYQFANPLVDEILQGKKIKDSEKAKMIEKVHMRQYISWIIYGIIAYYL